MENYMFNDPDYAINIAFYQNTIKSLALQKFC